MPTAPTTTIFTCFKGIEIKPFYLGQFSMQIVGQFSVRIDTTQNMFRSPIPRITSCSVPEYCHRTSSIFWLLFLSMIVSSATRIPGPSTLFFAACHTSRGRHSASANHRETLSCESEFGDTSDNAFAVYLSLVTRKNAAYNSLLHFDRLTL